MSKKKKKKGVCSPKVQYGVTLANFRISVKHYAISKMCKETAKKSGINELLNFFTGLVQGYNDWYHFLGITDEQFLAVYKEFDIDTLKREAKETINRILEGGKKEKKGVILASSVGAKELKAAREIFDKHLSVGGGRR